MWVRCQAREGVLLASCKPSAGEELRLHPSCAHFGCSFNRTRDSASGEGYADPWHLADAAAYTAIALLSPPCPG